MSLADLKAFYKGKKVLITGHTGFKGSWLTELLLQLGADVVGVSLSPPSQPNMFEALGLSQRIRDYRCDIRNFPELRRIFAEEKPDFVFHLAAQALVKEGYKDPVGTFSTNVMGTVHVLEAARTSNVKGILLITTDKVYENKEWPWPYREIDELGGHEPYSASKACAELAAKAYHTAFLSKANIPLATARAGNVIGGGDWGKWRLVPDVIRAVFENKLFALRNPKAIRPWQHVLDPLHGYLLLLKAIVENPNLCGPWNFAPNEDSFITAQELVRLLLKQLGKNLAIKVQLSREKESQTLKLDASKAKALLGWRPKLSLKQAVAWTAEWYRAFYEGQDVAKITRRQIREFFR